MQINWKRIKPHENHDFDTPAGGVKRIAWKRCKSIEIDVNLTQIIVSDTSSRGYQTDCLRRLQINWKRSKHYRNIVFDTPLGCIKRIARNRCKSMIIDANLAEYIVFDIPVGESNADNTAHPRRHRCNVILWVSPFADRRPSQVSEQLSTIIQNCSTRGSFTNGFASLEQCTMNARK